MKRLSVAAVFAVSAIGFAQIASAADLPRKAPVYTPPPAPIFSWTGCYVGGNVGYGWGKNQVTDFITVPGFDVGSETGTGVVGSGQIQLRRSRKGV
jgi:outer membrane immunogenic protein